MSLSFPVSVSFKFSSWGPDRSTHVRPLEQSLFTVHGFGFDSIVDSDALCRPAAMLGIPKSTCEFHFISIDSCKQHEGTAAIK
jgi:hypothetical protein